jgi:uncharacterized protein with FMN-binding domain
MLHQDSFRFSPIAAALVAVLLFLIPPRARAADIVELQSGAKVTGEVLARTDKDVTIRYKIGSYTYTRTYPLSLVHAITSHDEREVVGERALATPVPKPGRSASKPDGRASSATTVSAEPNSRRSREEIRGLVAKVGGTPPEWYESTPLDYPESLDLSWPKKPPGNWNNQKNIGQYIWDILNPNPGKWHAGVRFMHHLLEVHKDNAETRTRAMLALGRMYFNLLEDYPRAAFWWQKAGVARGTSEDPVAGVHLAECYWRMGSREMAVDLLGKLPPAYASIKLWADLGQTRKALQIADAFARGGNADIAYLYAGDACRVAGDFPQALKYYQKVIDTAATGKASNRSEKDAGRARANIEAIKLFELSDVSRVADGTYKSSSLGYETQVAVEVVVRDRRIDAVRVTQHHEKQFYSALSDTPKRIIAKQGVRGVDATSGATITSEAIINATAKALAAAAK